MQRYFFHRMDGGVDRDDEGTELPNLESARREAVLYAAETLRERPEWVSSDGELRVEVTDVDGQALFAVVISARTAVHGH